MILNTAQPMPLNRTSLKEDWRTKLSHYGYQNQRSQSVVQINSLTMSVSWPKCRARDHHYTVLESALSWSLDPNLQMATMSTSWPYFQTRNHHCTALRTAPSTSLELLTSSSSKTSSFFAQFMANCFTTSVHLFHFSFFRFFSAVSKSLFRCAFFLLHQVHSWFLIFRTLCQFWFLPIFTSFSDCGSKLWCHSVFMIAS